MVHERLYRKENLSKINLKQYLSELVQELIKVLPVHITQIKVVEDLKK